MVPQTVGTGTAYAVGEPPDITFGDVIYEIFGRLVELYESRGILEIYDSCFDLLGSIFQILGVSENGMRLGINDIGIELSTVRITEAFLATINHCYGVRRKSKAILNLVYVDFTSNEISISRRKGVEKKRVFSVRGRTTKYNFAVEVL